MDDFDRLLQENAPVEPSPAFENRLFAALEAKQRELGRIPAAVPVRPVPPPDRRGVRISLVALSSLAAGLTIGLSLSGQVAPERAAPSIQRDLVGVPTPPAGVEVRLPDVTLPKPAPVTSAAPAEVVAIASATPPAPPVQVVAATTPTRLPLEDGSVVFLDAGARARIGARTVTLESGRGFVEVAKGEKPFTVLSGGARAIAHGTKFAFEQGARGLSVAVSQGTVELANALGDALVHVGELGRAEGSSAPTATAAPRVSSLCEWMRDLYAPRKADKTAAGDLVAFDPDGQEIHLSTRNVLVTVHIEDGIARTTVDTTYYNETWNRLEGTFTFVAPEGASVSRLAMHVNGELQEGGVLERTEARQVYEQIRYERRRDPALLEWMEGNVYRMRIFPLEPRQEKRVIVSYTQELEPLYGKLRYALPLEVRGREVYEHLGIKVRIKRARRVPVSSFPLDVAHEGEDLLLSREEIQVQPKKDLILYLDELVPTATTLEAEDGRYVLARWRPAVAAAKRSNDPRHFAIVVEESGARTQADIIAQNELVSRFLSELDDRDQFQLFALSSRIQRFRGDWAPARENAGEALA